MEADYESGSPNLSHHGSNLPTLLIPFRHYNLYISLKRKIPKHKINPEKEREKQQQFLTRTGKLAHVGEAAADIPEGEGQLVPFEAEEPELLAVP